MSGDICRRTLFAPTVYRANNSVVDIKKRADQSRLVFIERII
nr:MAG TPA: hypothetical protein [Caudoviricetes sp.]